MADSYPTFPAALRAAVRAVRLDPKLPHLAATGDPAYVARFQRFMLDPDVRAHLLTKRYCEHEATALQLLADAEEYLSVGEAERVRRLYATQLASGQLEGLSAHVRDVHRAVFALAVVAGATPLVSLRYLATVVASFGSAARLTPSTAGRALRKLHKLGLVEYLPAPRTRDRSLTSRVRLDLITADPSVVIAPYVTEALVLSGWTELDLQEYVKSSREAARPPGPTDAQKAAIRATGRANDKTDGLSRGTTGPTYELCRSLVRQLHDGVTCWGEDCHATQLHDEVHLRDLVCEEWFDPVVMTRAVIAELGLRPDGHWLCTRGSGRFEPRNVEWRLPPERVLQRKPHLRPLFQQVGYSEDCICPWEVRESSCLAFCRVAQAEHVLDSFGEEGE